MWLCFIPCFLDRLRWRIPQTQERNIGDQSPYIKYIWPARSSTFSSIAYSLPSLHWPIHCAFWPSILQHPLEFSDTVVLLHCSLRLKFSFLCTLSFKGCLSNHVIHKIFLFSLERNTISHFEFTLLLSLLFSFWFLSYSLEWKAPPDGGASSHTDH